MQRPGRRKPPALQPCAPGRGHERRGGLADAGTAARLWHRLGDHGLRDLRRHGADAGGPRRAGGGCGFPELPRGGGPRLAGPAGSRLGPGRACGGADRAARQPGALLRLLLPAILPADLPAARAPAAAAGLRGLRGGDGRDVVRAAARLAARRRLGRDDAGAGRARHGAERAAWPERVPDGRAAGRGGAGDGPAALGGGGGAGEPRLQAAARPARDPGAAGRAPLGGAGRCGRRRTGLGGGDAGRLRAGRLVRLPRPPARGGGCGGAGGAGALAVAEPVRPAAGDRPRAFGGGGGAGGRDARGDLHGRLDAAPPPGRAGGDGRGRRRRADHHTLRLRLRHDPASGAHGLDPGRGAARRGGFLPWERAGLVAAYFVPAASIVAGLSAGIGFGALAPAIMLALVLRRIGRAPSG